MMNDKYIMVEAAYFCKIRAEAEARERYAQWYNAEMEKANEFRGQIAALKEEIGWLKAELGAAK